MPRKLTRPKRITYRCTEEIYECFHRRRKQIGLTTGEMFDSLFKGSDNSYRLTSRIQELVKEMNKYKKFYNNVMQAGGK